MKTSQIATVCGLLLLLSCTKLAAQNPSQISILPAYNPSSVHLKIVSNEVCLSSSSYLTASHAQVEVKAFAPKEYNDQELQVPMVQVDLVRRGKLIGKTEFTGQGDLSYLMTKAKEGDIFVFSVQRLLIQSPDNEYQTFTSGRISFQYEFKETEGLVLNR